MRQGRSRKATSTAHAHRHWNGGRRRHWNKQTTKAPLIWMKRETTACCCGSSLPPAAYFHRFQLPSFSGPRSLSLLMLGDDVVLMSPGTSPALLPSFCRRMSVGHKYKCKQLLPLNHIGTFVQGRWSVGEATRHGPHTTASPFFRSSLKTRSPFHSTVLLLCDHTSQHIYAEKDKQHGNVTVRLEKYAMAMHLLSLFPSLSSFFATTHHFIAHLWPSRQGYCKFAAFAWCSKPHRPSSLTASSQAHRNKIGENGALNSEISTTD
ncbi:hypothetical protein IWX90DRAFT_273047 [Phyllosticta citrichinensis]|uniref:Uncharacterized protein n=1 Tax=Phyllosticta citrichinensis TaxID=1130410 RepID=A0ABR1XN12_9PEZI